jgi:hypothetical protein
VNKPFIATVSSGLGSVPLLDGGGEPGRGQHPEVGGRQQVAGHALGVGDRRARITAPDLADHRLDGAKGGVEGRQASGERAGVTRF